MKTIKENYKQSPIAWFYVLILARKRGDSRTEKTAVKNLSRLGVGVTFQSKAVKRGE